MDCKLIICDIIKDCGGMKVANLEEKASFLGVDKKTFSRSLNLLCKRGIVYMRSGGVVELADPNLT